MKSEAKSMRFDLKIIASWIEPRSKVLDLGCGSGELLYHLKREKQVIGTGIDRHEDQVARCISKGLTVLQGDINEEVLDYPDKAFDYVILSQTLQQVYEPAELLETLLRIGRQVVVSFPSFSHWAVRLSLLLTGSAPVTKELPYEWHNTPNIRVISIKDFKNFSKKVGFTILREAAVNTHISDKRDGYIIKILPALRATYGIFLIAENHC